MSETLELSHSVTAAMTYIYYPTNRNAARNEALIKATLAPNPNVIDGAKIQCRRMTHADDVLFLHTDMHGVVCVSAGVIHRTYLSHIQVFFVLFFWLAVNF